MATTLDCPILGNFFGSNRMRAIFDTRRLLQSWLDVWAALAEAEASVGMIPEDAATKIRAAARAENFDVEEIGAGIAAGRHSLMPAIRALTAAAGDAGKYVHWGTTTQDITDTGTVLQLREALDVIEGEVRVMVRTLSDLAVKYRAHAMAGRTHWQHAVPITFGLKVALWVEELDHHLERLARSRENVLTAEIWGGGGTMASLGEHAAAVQKELSRRLGLKTPEVPWYNLRDHLAELVSHIGLLAATIERICLEVGRLTGTDIGELDEPKTAVQVGSSTMPQKRNPIMTERAAAGCKLVRGLVPVMQSLMIVTHERDMAATAAEWLLVPQCMILMDGALELTSRVLSGLQVDAERMTQNLGITGGGIVAEAVMMGLAAHMGRGRAHELSLELAKEAHARKCSLGEVLLDNEEVRAVLSGDQIRALVEPENYLGRAGEVVDGIVARAKAHAAATPAARA